MRKVFWAPLLVILAGCSREMPPQPSSAEASKTDATTFVGSKTCITCHADFYKLWSTSWHGLAMQPYTTPFAKEHLTTQQADIAIGKRKFRAETREGQGWVREKGPEGEKRYSILHVMGGKNVYYFLTSLERGRLQVLPVAYDVRQRAWFDTAASGVRHFPDRRDEALDWKDRLFTFNTTCFNCHVSRLATNFDLKTETYHTTWGEPGISCESCHGPASEHVRITEAGGKGQTSRELGILRTKEFSCEQMNDLCATCHAKLIPLSTDFAAGDKFFDHYDLLTLEHPDYYPDGRDLGENYTYTSWLMSPCLKSGKLDCNHCHTPSGRLRFGQDQGNQSCMPCHENHVKNPAAHGHHTAGSKGNECLACHMPMTRFAAMGRTDHSMRPPMPAATIAYKSPNACNLCHADHDAAWADEWVRKWYARDYQAEPLRRAGLVDAARKGLWDRLPEMLAEVARSDTDAVGRNTLARLLNGCEDPRAPAALLTSLKDPSPLVRASAAAALGGRMTLDGIEPLLAAVADPSRLVRIRAAAALAAIPPERLQNPSQRAALERATAEFLGAMKARPDDWASYANLGNFYMERRDFAEAIKQFENAQRLEPRMVGPWVNAAMAYSNLGRNDQAERCLRRALELEPANPAACFNLGLLLAETERLEEAEKMLRAALKSDPQMAAAAYNLGVLLAGKKNMAEAIEFCQKAHALRPDDPKFTSSLAFYLRQEKKTAEAAEVLRAAIERNPAFLDGYVLLAEIYESQGDRKAAIGVLRKALAQEGLSPQARQQIEAKVQTLSEK